MIAIRPRAVSHTSSTAPTEPPTEPLTRQVRGGEEERKRGGEEKEKTKRERAFKNEFYLLLFFICFVIFNARGHDEWKSGNGPETGRTGRGSSHRTGHRSSSLLVMSEMVSGRFTVIDEENVSSSSSPSPSPSTLSDKSSPSHSHSHLPPHSHQLHQLHHTHTHQTHQRLLHIHPQHSSSSSSSVDRERERGGEEEVGEREREERRDRDHPIGHEEDEEARREGGSGGEEQVEVVRVDKADEAGQVDEGDRGGKGDEEDSSRVMRTRFDISDENEIDFELSISLPSTGRDTHLPLVPLHQRSDSYTRTMPTLSEMPMSMPMNRPVSSLNDHPEEYTDQQVQGSEVFYYEDDLHGSQRTASASPIFDTQLSEDSNSTQAHLEAEAQALGAMNLLSMLYMQIRALLQENEALKQDNFVLQGQNDELRQAYEELLQKWHDSNCLFDEAAQSPASLHSTESTLMSPNEYESGNHTGFVLPTEIQRVLQPQISSSDPMLESLSSDFRTPSSSQSEGSPCAREEERAQNGKHNANQFTLMPPLERDIVPSSLSPSNLSSNPPTLSDSSKQLSQPAKPSGIALTAPSVTRSIKPSSPSANASPVAEKMNIEVAKIAVLTNKNKVKVETPSHGTPVLSLTQANGLPSVRSSLISSQNTTSLISPSLSHKKSMSSSSANTNSNFFDGLGLNPALVDISSLCNKTASKTENKPIVAAALNLQLDLRKRNDRDKNPDAFAAIANGLKMSTVQSVQSQANKRDSNKK